MKVIVCFCYCLCGSIILHRNRDVSSDAILPGTPLDQMSFPGCSGSRENLLHAPDRNSAVDERPSPTGAKNSTSVGSGGNKSTG